MDFLKKKKKKILVAHVLIGSVGNQKLTICCVLWALISVYFLCRVCQAWRRIGLWALISVYFLFRVCQAWRRIGLWALMSVYCLCSVCRAWRRIGLWALIFVYFIFRVCRAWRRVVRDNSLWRHVNLIPYRLNLHKMWRVIRSHFSAVLLSLHFQGYLHPGEFTSRFKKWNISLVPNVVHSDYSLLKFLP